MPDQRSCAAHAINPVTGNPVRCVAGAGHNAPHRFPFATAPLRMAGDREVSATTFAWLAKYQTLDEGERCHWYDVAGDRLCVRGQHDLGSEHRFVSRLDVVAATGYDPVEAMHDEEAPPIGLADDPKFQPAQPPPADDLFPYAADYAKSAAERRAAGVSDEAHTAWLRTRTGRCAVLSPALGLPCRGIPGHRGSHYLTTQDGGHWTWEDGDTGLTEAPDHPSGIADLGAAVFGAYVLGAGAPSDTASVRFQLDDEAAQVAVDFAITAAEPADADPVKLAHVYAMLSVSRNVARIADAVERFVEHVFGDEEALAQVKQDARDAVRWPDPGTTPTYGGRP